MEKKEKKAVGIVLIAIAILLGMMYFGGYLIQGPQFDGDTTQDFKIEITSYEEEAVRGGVTTADLTIVNEGETGTMFVECGLYDRETRQGEWVPREGLDSEVEENCRLGEDFVQTKRVNLSSGESVSVGFEMNVPESYGDDIALYCNSFERCWSSLNPETHQTSQDVKEVKVIEDVDRQEFLQNNILGFVNMDRQGTDAKILDWIHSNSILFTALLIGMLVVGAAIVYKEEEY